MNMYVVRAVAMMAAVWAIPAIAQTMFKCEIAGKIQYSDRACSAGVEIKRIAPDGGPTAEDRARANMRVAAESERFAAQERRDEDARQLNRDARAVSSVPAASPDSDNEKVTTHGKSGWDRKTRGQIAAEQKSIGDGRERARQGQAPPVPSDSPASAGKAWESEKVMVQTQTGWKNKTRAEVVNDAGTSAYRGEKTRIENAKRPTGTITSCDPGGCMDSYGNRYNGSGGTLFGTDGRVCQRVGTTLQCN